jgi:Lrp/AsnC family transcriptional regulator for asnA, asnC and gidA
VKKIEVDEVDRRLLALVQANSETPYVELAKSLEISPSGVHKRVKRLMKAGIIKKFVALIDSELLGKKLKAFVGISTSPGACGKVIMELGKRPEVLEIHEMAGEHDLFVKLITEDTLKLNDILHDIDRIPGVSSTRTFIVLKTEKETNVVRFD